MDAGNLANVLRVLLTPRWWGWTLFALLAVAVCGLMTWWQVVRADGPGGSLLNAGYAFQWPLFGLFFAFLWWRMLSAEARTAAESGPSPSGAEPSEPSGQSEPSERSGPPVPTGAARPARARRAVEPLRAPDASSPFGPRPAGVDEDRDAPAAGSARARHNAHFAQLAETIPEDRP